MTFSCSVDRPYEAPCEVVERRRHSSHFQTRLNLGRLHMLNYLSQRSDHKISDGAKSQYCESPAWTKFIHHHGWPAAQMVASRGDWSSNYAAHRYVSGIVRQYHSDNHCIDESRSERRVGKSAQFCLQGERIRARFVARCVMMHWF